MPAGLILRKKYDILDKLIPKSARLETSRSEENDFAIFSKRFTTADSTFITKYQFLASV